MPLYDYRCERGHRYEKRESFGAPAEQPCERCGRTARRLINAPAIAFKGSGWYKTDSRGEEPRGGDDRKAKSGSSTESTSSNGSSSDASDSKASKAGKNGKSGKSSKAKKADTAKAD